MVSPWFSQQGWYALESIQTSTTQRPVQKTRPKQDPKEQQIYYMEVARKSQGVTLGCWDFQWGWQHSMLRWCTQSGSKITFDISWKGSLSAQKAHHTWNSRVPLQGLSKTDIQAKCRSEQLQLCTCCVEGWFETYYIWTNRQTSQLENRCRSHPLCWEASFLPLIHICTLALQRIIVQQCIRPFKLNDDIILFWRRKKRFEACAGNLCL